MPAARQTVSSTPRRVDIDGMIDTLNLSTVGGRITWSRIRKELRQEDVAKKLGKSRATIVQYEKDNINPPVAQIERLAKLLDVAPEWLAFARQGVEAMRHGKAEEVVTMGEMSVGGRKGHFESGAVALPRAFFANRDINLERTKMFVLDHDEDEFQFYDGDRLIVDQSATEIGDESRRMFLVEIDGNKPSVVARESMTNTGKVRLMDGAGKTHLYPIESVKVLGAINGVLALV